MNLVAGLKIMMSEEGPKVAASPEPVRIHPPKAKSRVWGDLIVRLKEDEIRRRRENLAGAGVWKRRFTSSSISGPTSGFTTLLKQNVKMKKLVKESCLKNWVSIKLNLTSGKSLFTS